MNYSKYLSSSSHDKENNFFTQIKVWEYQRKKTTGDRAIGRMTRTEVLTTTHIFVPIGRSGCDIPNRKLYTYLREILFKNFKYKKQFNHT